MVVIFRVKWYPHSQFSVCKPTNQTALWSHRTYKRSTRTTFVTKFWGCEVKMERTSYDQQGYSFSCYRYCCCCCSVLSIYPSIHLSSLLFPSLPFSSFLFFFLLFPFLSFPLLLFLFLCILPHLRALILDISSCTSRQSKQTKHQFRALTFIANSTFMPTLVIDNLGFIKTENQSIAAL